MSKARAIVLALACVAAGVIGTVAYVAPAMPGAGPVAPAPPPTPDGQKAASVVVRAGRVEVVDGAGAMILALGVNGKGEATIYVTVGSRVLAVSLTDIAKQYGR